MIPHWKPAELRPTHVPEVTSKEALRRFLALERKLNSTKNKKLKGGYEESIHKNISSGMLQKYGSYNDFKEEFMTSHPIEGEEEKFKALAHSHLVVQCKENHPICFTIDYTNLNAFFFKAANSLSPIEERVAEMRAYRYIIGMDISKQYHQILSQHPMSQCVIHRTNPNEPLDVYIHAGLLMGNISSSSLATLCMIETGRLFDATLEEARRGTLDYDAIYPPLSKALMPGETLDPKVLPSDFSLERIITQSWYADNVIECSDDRSVMVKEAVATVLALNSYSFKIHEVFSNVVPELLLIVDLVRGYGGHIELHSEIERLLKDLEDPQDIDMEVDKGVSSNQCVIPKSDLDQGESENIEELSEGGSVEIHGEKSKLYSPKNSKKCQHSYDLSLVMKSFLYHKNDFLSYHNPLALIRICGLHLEICKSRMNNDMLQFLISYKNLGGLTNFSLTQLSLRKISEVLGSLWEACPYILTALKSPVKLALHMTYKIKHVLGEHKKLLLSLLTYSQAPKGQLIDSTAEKLYLKYRDHPIYAKLINLGSATIDTQMAQIKKLVPILTWDSCLISVRSQILECSLKYHMYVLYCFNFLNSKVVLFYFRQPCLSPSFFMLLCPVNVCTFMFEEVFLHTRRRRSNRNLK